jgi:hypothetical protein
MPLRTRSRRTFAPNDRIRVHSFLLRGTTYYIPWTGKCGTIWYIVKEIAILYAKLRQAIAKECKAISGANHYSLTSYGGL